MEWFQLGMAGLQGLAGAFRGRAEREAGRQARQTAYYNASALDREADALDAESAENQMRMRAMQGVATGQAAAQTAASASRCSARTASARVRSSGACSAFWSRSAAAS